GGVEAEAVRLRGAHARGDEVERQVQRDAVEAGLAAAAEHRVREAPESAQLGVAALAERGDVGERVGIHRAHRVERQEREARRAEVDALDRPVAEAADAERAAVAHAAREDAPGVERRVLVVPRCAGHLEVVVWLRASDAERREAGPEPRLHRASLRYKVDARSRAVTMRTPRCSIRTSRSLSPVTMDDAFPAIAAARTASS